MLSDDGIGARLAGDLEKKFKEENIHFASMAVVGLDIIETIRNYELLIVIDGIRTAQGIPGTVMNFSMDNCPPTLHLHSFHDAHLRESVLIAKMTGISMPESVCIITVEIQDDLTFSYSLSTPLENQIQEISAQVYELINRYISNPSILQCHEQIQ